MHIFWIYYNGQLFQREVYKTKYYKEPIDYAGDGRLGYIMQGDREITLIFNEDLQIFHPPEICAERMAEIVGEQRLAEARNT